MAHQSNKQNASVTRLAPQTWPVVITDEEEVDTAPCEYQPKGVDDEEPSY